MIEFQIKLLIFSEIGAYFDFQGAETKNQNWSAGCIFQGK